MLFMGSKKYPKEDEYHKYIENLGGKCNAYTSD
jgi:secreted Zn-dependent insulinase-like peptidase